MKQQIYNLIDRTVLGVFGRAKHHRELGERFQDHIAKNLPGVIMGLRAPNANIISQNLKDYGCWAYLEVQGQTLLINMDVIGTDIETRSTEAYDAALAVGLGWYAVKIIDNHIDKKPVRGRELEDFLGDMCESWKTGNPSRVNDVDGSIIVDTTTDLIHTGYVGDPGKYAGTIEDLCHAEIKFLESSPREKVDAAKDVGRKSSDFTLAVARQYLPDYAEGLDECMRYQGITGKMIDDFKDFRVDRAAGEGYSLLSLPRICFEGLKNFGLHVLTLPDVRAQWRLHNFFALGGLFHLQEWMGLKNES